MGDIIDFPNKGAGRADEPYHRDPNLKTDEQQYLLDYLLSNLMGDLFDEGYDVTRDDIVLDTSFLYEVIKSMVLKLDGYHHPIQDLADDIYHRQSHHFSTENISEDQLEFEFEDVQDT